MEPNKVYYSDALDVLRGWPDEFVDTCVTSPPYYSLRDYGTGRWEGGDAECDHSLPRGGQGASSAKQVTSGGTQVYQYTNTCPRCGAIRIDQQIGLEDTPDAFIARLVEVFREAKRVLKPTGTLWLNIADSYAGGGHNSGNKKEISEKQASNAGNRFEKMKVPDGLKPKDLMGIPWRLAMALQADGWYLRDCIIWAKGREYSDDDVGLNPMPGSQKDRCTSAYEFIFLLSKRPRYYFDWMAIAEPPRQSSKDRIKVPSGWDTADGAHGSFHPDGRGGPEYKPVKFGGNKGGGDHGNAERTYSGNEWNPAKYSFRRDSTKYGNGQPDHKQPQHRADRDDTRYNGPLVMPRNVWIFPTRGFKGSHYATFPPELPRRCILAGSSAHGCCSACGKPWVRVSEKHLVPGAKSPKNDVYDERDQQGHDAGDQGSNRRRDGHKQGYHHEVTQRGWQPACQCAADVVPAVILDPFMGSGTSAAAAEQLHRNWIGIDLDERNDVHVQQRLAEVREAKRIAEHNAKYATASLFDDRDD